MRGMPRKLTNILRVIRDRNASQPMHDKSANILMLSGWFGLLTGFLEALILAFQKSFLNQILSERLLSKDVYWMAPVADLCWFVILSLILYLLLSRLPIFKKAYVIILASSFLGSLSLLFMVRGLSKIAAVLLATGIAIQVTRFINLHYKKFISIVRGTIIWMFTLVIMIALVINGEQAIVGNLAKSYLAPSKPGASNIILIVLDTVRARNLSLYGYTRDTTPQLERLAKKGVVFDNAFSTAPWTLPSHSSFFTGVYPDKLSANWTTPLDATYPTLAEVLRDHGYLTAGFVANMYYCSEDNGLNRGFIHYEDFPITLGQIVQSSSLSRTLFESFTFRRIINYYDDLNRKRADQVNKEFLNWLDHRGNRPFFAFLNYFDAHEPYLPPQPFDKKFGSLDNRDMLGVATWEYNTPPTKYIPLSKINIEMKAYDDSIAYMDHQIGLLYNELNKRGILDNTLLIIVSDHGEEFGEHGLVTHGNSLYLTELQVPLLILFPSRVPENKRIQTPVSLINLPATILDLLGIKGKTILPGSSLAQFWNINGKDSNRAEGVISEVKYHPNMPEWFPTSKGEMKSLVVGNYQYILNGDGSEEIYNYVNDVWEKQDIVNTPEGRRLLVQFRKMLEKALVQNP